ncbi:fibronectin type III-like domain-contianing protein [Parabacteroides sp. OttesenSCG-928-N08]|nr:fibronectin type III-like domain-contianing protein [Parabacteroides sp. OttesenSCG-928-N08]
MDGYETIHWFISDPACSISRPLKELKHFEKRLLKAGVTAVFRFEIDPEQHFSYVDHEGTRFTESGDYFIIVKDKRVKVELVN